MAIDPHGLLAAALSVRVTADTTGLDAEIASKLTAAERRAILTSQRVSAATGRVTEVGIASSAKLEVATLRQTAAQESYNRLLRAGESDTIRLARAQASLIAAQAGVRREQTRLTEATAATAAKGEVATAGILGSTRTLLGAAAGIGVFTALKRGVTAYEQLTGSVRQFQRVTKASAPDASRFVAILQRYGLDGDRATQAILRFGRNIDEHPAKLRSFGVEIAKNADGTTNLTKTLLNANDAFQRTPDAAHRASFALSLFGRGGQALYPILTANRNTLKEFMDQAQRSGVVFSQADLDRAKQLAMSQKDMTQAWQGFEILLARGIVPALHDVDRAGTTVMNLFTNHQTAGMAVLRIGEVAAGLYAVNRAIKSFDAVRNSTLFTKLFNVGETQAQAAANLELAGTYRAIGAAAAGAVPEVAALSGVEAAGGAAGGAGVLGEMAALRATIPAASGGLLARLGVRLGTAGGGILAGGAIAASAIDPVILASLLAGGDQTPKDVKAANATENQLLGQFSYSHGAFYAGNQKVTDQRLITLLRDQGLGPALNGQEANAAMRFYPRLFKGSSASVVGAQNQALGAFLAGATPDQIQAASHAQGIAAATQAGQQYASGVDIFARAPSLTPQAAAGSSQALDNARTRAADAARRVTLDEERLNALRNGKTKPTALALASAEETLRLAKERSAQASRAVQTAEGKTTAARLPTARSLLSTTTSQANRAALDAKAVERLYGVGLRKDVVDKIIAQNATTPGALESIAKPTTPKLALALERQFRQIRLNGSIIAGTPQQWETAGSQRALDFMRGVENVFNQAAPAVVRARVAGVQRKIDAGMPVTSRTRQRALSGSPSLPHGA